MGKPSSRSVRSAVALAALLLLPLPALGQEDPSSDEPGLLETLDGSLGLGSGGHGVAMAGFVSVPAGPGDLMIRVAQTGFGDRSAGDLGLLYGHRLATAGGRLWARAAAGATWATWTRAGELYNCRTAGVFPFTWEQCDRDFIDEHGIALAFQLDGVWEVGGSWGVGATWFSSTGGPRGFTGWSVNFFFRPFGRSERPPRVP